METNKQPEDGHVIDVEPEVETPAEPSTTQTNEKKLLIALVLAIIAIVTVSASWIAGYRYWQTVTRDMQGIQERITLALKQQSAFNEKIEETRKQLEQQKQQIQKQAEEIIAQSEKLEQDKRQIQQQTETMQQAVADVSAKIGRSNNQWMIAEAHYLMRIANQRLLLAYDIQTAIHALQQADQRIMESGDLGLIPVREQLAREIAALKFVTQPDIAGLAAKLKSLSSRIPDLKLSGMALTRSQTVDNRETSDTPRERSLKTLAKDSWEGFRKLIVIRQHEQPISAMLPPSQQYFLFQNLQLQLETARIALLRRESDIYHHSLETAKQWLSDYFEKDDSTSQNILKALAELDNTDIKPVLPDISRSLSQLSRYMEAAQ